MNSTALICVTHDPNGNNRAFAKRFLPLFNEIYDELFIAVSDKTDKALINELDEAGFKVKIIPKKGTAHARREAIKFALEGCSEYFHYCDFDRLLTWADRYSDELKNMILNVKDNDYTILGRTERAFKSHPVEWIETEKIANKIFSLEFGKEVDITAGSCCFSRRCAELISGKSKDRMTDAEWPMIAHRIGNLKVGYTAAEGLEYIEDINGEVIDNLDSTKWFKRVELCYIISESAINTGKE